jgi:outer membrane receptor for ferrienterochelin and colicin
MLFGHLVGLAFSLAATDISGVVTDSASSQPIAGAQISVMQDARVVVNTIADDFGRYRIHDLSAGRYTISARSIGFRAESRVVNVDGSAGVTTVNFRLETVALSLAAIEVRAATPLAIDTRTGEQSFRQDDYHGAPTATTSQILQESIAGAARAPTGEVHIRGQHAEYTYYVDGVPVPSGISGSLNELFDPEVVNQITFQTGGWDAEYGNKNLAVVNVNTKIPAGGFHADASAYAGSFNSSGQSLSLSTNAGRLGMFGSFARQVTDMRREPVAFDTLTFAPVNVHNHGEDLFTFGKLTYAAGDADVLNVDANWSRTTFEVPFNPALTASFSDRQRDVNSFVNLSWRHRVAQKDELFAGAFFRHGSLDYLPGANDEPQFYFYPDTITAYDLSEARSFNTLGVKLDYTLHAAQELEFRSGLLAQRTTGSENFQSFAKDGALGPGSAAALRGGDVGLYTQVAWSPVEKLELRTGVRFDAHSAPFAGTQRQVSPRVRLNFFPGAATTLYAYYGRLFVPTNVEEVRTITTAAVGTADQPTLPERDDFYELGLVHRFSELGVVAKFSGYYKESSPGIDDATIPGTAIVTSVNIARIWTKGLEGVLEIRPGGPFSGYVNASVIHAYGKAPITGGFLPSEPPSGYFDLDHDQRYSFVASGTWSAHRTFVSATAIYGSGLTNGFTTDDLPNADYGTGLFARNAAFKTDPGTIVNASAGYSIVTSRAVLRPQLYVENLFDKRYLLKGAFFSGASVGRPRSVQLRLSVGV